MQKGLFKIFVSLFIAVLIAANPVTAQQVQPSAPEAQQTHGSAISKPRPVSMPHLYWHFLIYVNILDRKAAILAAQGGNGNRMRNDLQHRLRFSDADFAPIRSSSQRLASELAAINQKMKTLRPLSPSVSKASQMETLITQREAYINNEVDYLDQTLSPEKRAALESFMTQFFAPKPLVIHPSAATSNQ